MNLSDVMTEVAEASRVIDGLRVHEQPVGAVTPPALMVLYPDQILFDETYGRGSDSSDAGFLLVVGKPYDRATKELLGELTAGGGLKSLKAAIEAYSYASCDSVRLASIEFDVVTIGGVDYMGGLGKLQIFGEGTP